MSLTTPWGPSQGCSPTKLKGIEFHHTASHGGLRVSPDLRGKLKQHEGKCIGAGFVGPDGSTWWEEDCAAAFVIVEYPEAFEPESQEMARRSIEWLGSRAY